VAGTEWDSGRLEDLPSITDRAAVTRQAHTWTRYSVFDLKGTRMGNGDSKLPDKLDGPSLALANGKLYVLNWGGNHVSSIDL